jgi:uncharacterized protein with NRDE domain
MCLLSIAWKVHPDYPLVFVGNRDEHHARPTAAANWWEDYPDVLGGRDLEAGGSWLAITRQGRFAVVTNRPDLPAPAAGGRSRGELVTGWLQKTESPLDRLGERAQLYGGFSLLLGDRDQLTQVSGGRGVDKLEVQSQQRGISGLSNTAISDPWPKLTWLNRQLEQQLSSGQPDIERLFELLLTSKPVSGSPTTGVSGRPFVVGEHYGTRSSSVITINRAGDCQFVEKRFGPGGRAVGESAYQFHLEAGPS